MGSDKKISILFFGTPGFACPSLTQLAASPLIDIKAVITQTSKPKGRGQKEQDSEICEHATKLGIKTILKPKKINLQNINPEDIDALRLAEIIKSEKIDFGIVVAYGKIIPESMLEVPTFGFLNVHPSSLPLWRGAAPLQHTIFSGADTTSVCIIKLVKELDAGPIYASQELQNIKSFNLQELHDTCATIGGEMLVKTIIDIKDSNIQYRVQSEENITYAHKWSKEDCKINFSDSPEKTFNRIRACSPKPGAFCKYENNNIKIFSSKLHTISNDLHIAQLTLFQAADNKSTLGVSLSKQHILEIEEVQLEGKSRIQSSDFLNTKNLRDRLRSREAIFLTCD